MRPEQDGLAELQRLVARLEQSGLAGQRPEVAALIARSRSLLGPAGTSPAARDAFGDPAGARAARPVSGAAPAAGRAFPPRPGPYPGFEPPSRPTPRPPRRAAIRPAAKLRLLFLMAIDMALGLVAAAALAGLLAGTAPARLAGPVLAVALAWVLWRWGGAPAAAAEAMARLRYARRWAWLWFAEAFSEAAFEALQDLLDAREVMRGWQAWRRELGHRPRLADVDAFLAERFGAQAVLRFRFAMAVQGESRRGWTLRGGYARNPAPVREAEAMRWSRLILAFEAVARDGALWPAADAAWSPPAAPPPAEAPPPVEDPDHAARMQRRLELKEAIKRKREEIRRTTEWKMKTPAEIAQQDAHLALLRGELAALEAELKALA